MNIINSCRYYCIVYLYIVCHFCKSTNNYFASPVLAVCIWGSRMMLMPNSKNCLSSLVSFFLLLSHSQCLCSVALSVWVSVRSSSSSSLPSSPPPLSPSPPPLPPPFPPPLLPSPSPPPSLPLPLSPIHTHTHTFAAIFGNEVIEKYKTNLSLSHSVVLFATNGVPEHCQDGVCTSCLRGSTIEIRRHVKHVPSAWKTSRKASQFESSPATMVSNYFC